MLEFIFLIFVVEKCVIVEEVFVIVVYRFVVCFSVGVIDGIEFFIMILVLGVVWNNDRRGVIKLSGSKVLFMYFLNYVRVLYLYEKCIICIRK